MEDEIVTTMVELERVMVVFVHGVVVSLSEKPEEDTGRAMELLSDG